MEGSRVLLYTEPAAHFCPERQNQIGKSSSMYRFYLVTEISRRPAYVPTLQCQVVVLQKCFLQESGDARQWDFNSNPIGHLLPLRGLCPQLWFCVQASGVCRALCIHSTEVSGWVLRLGVSDVAPCYWWWISVFLSAAFLKLCKTRRWGVHQDFVGTTAYWSWR